MFNSENVFAGFELRRDGEFVGVSVLRNPVAAPGVSFVKVLVDLGPAVGPLLLDVSEVE